MGERSRVSRPAPKVPVADPRTVAPAWGWRLPGAGRAAHMVVGAEYQATTVQACGLFPFMAGSGSPTVGVPIGRHMLWGEVVCLDPLEWLRAGLVTNPGVFVLGQPGVGKALDVDTPIATPAGWTRMGELRPGSTVFDEHGQPTTVVAVSDVLADRDCFEVVFSDGSVLVADAEHLWVTETNADRRRVSVAGCRPPARRPLGADEEIAAARRAAAAQPATETITLRQAAAELGWDRDARWQRLYRWAGQLQPVPDHRPGRGFHRDQVFGLVVDRLTGAVHDQRERIDTRGPVTTSQLRTTLRSAGKTNHAVPVSPPLRLPPADLPVHPYVLGAWLGDGTSTCGVITSADPQIVDHISAAGYLVRQVRQLHYAVSLPRPTRPTLPAVITCAVCQRPVRPRHPWQRTCSRGCASRARRLPRTPARRCPDCDTPLARCSVGLRCGPCHRAGTLLGRLRGLGVVGDKHIPIAYLRAGVDQRRALLAGLLDTDGTVSPGGQVQYTSTNERLAHDVYELVCSLGYRPTIRLGKARLGGIDCGPMWTVGFTTTDPVFRLDRKLQALAARARTTGARTRLRYIVDVRPVASRPVRCIQVANPSGLYLAGRSLITTHNSTIAKRLVMGMSAFGVRPFILGDPKPDYTLLIEHIGGQVIRIGRGLDRLNPLDSGPLGQALTTMSGPEAERLRLEIRGRRLSLLLGLCALVRGTGLDNLEEVVLGRAVDILTQQGTADPTVPDVLRLIMEGPENLRQAAWVHSEAEYRTRVTDLVPTLGLLCEGSLAGVFDGPTSHPIDLHAPGISVDISAVASAGDTLVSAAMLCAWAYGFGMIDASAVLADLGLAPRRNYLCVMDELWRALRGASGLVDHADSLTRLNRQKGAASIFLTHSLADLDALPTEADRAKARGFMERSAITILGGLPEKELRRVSQSVPLSEPEIDMIKGWAAPESWMPGITHPGRGKYMIKTGERIGIPVELSLVGREAQLYDTDTAIRRGDHT